MTQPLGKVICLSSILVFHQVFPYLMIFELDGCLNTQQELDIFRILVAGPQGMVAVMKVHVARL